MRCTPHVASARTAARIARRRRTPPAPVRVTRAASPRGAVTGNRSVRSRSLDHDLVGPVPAPRSPGAVDHDLVARDPAVPDHRMRRVGTDRAYGEMDDAVDHLALVV